MVQKHVAINTGFPDSGPWGGWATDLLVDRSSSGSNSCTDLLPFLESTSPYYNLNCDHPFFFYFPKCGPWSQKDKVREDMWNYARCIFPPLENDLPSSFDNKLLCLITGRVPCLGPDNTLFGRYRAEAEIISAVRSVWCWALCVELVNLWETQFPDVSNGNSEISHKELLFISHKGNLVTYCLKQNTSERGKEIRTAHTNQLLKVCGTPKTHAICFANLTPKIGILFIHSHWIATSVLAVVIFNLAI